MEKTFDRSAVLRKTNWGIDIYAHILRRFYPGEVVMKVTGRDCGIVRNPFAGGVQSLHVWFAKNDPKAHLSDETAYHHDENGAIPDGDALDFAALYYHQSGQELLATLNREMYLHLDAEHSQYAGPQTAHVDKGPKFSFFKAPITNKFPLKSITLLDAYNYIATLCAAADRGIEVNPRQEESGTLQAVPFRLRHLLRRIRRPFQLRRQIRQRTPLPRLRPSPRC